ncbi:putative membrane protein [Clostridium argentinense CDC 2741]|uniref:Putative membrane protein n=1 Tax=Clostridium argentinense CDC 2741 TaxID=1418104 RepID=A0A0C1TYJ4_9CLOT|nr:hypothetical protein [Clostridium argentinense]ARC83431.1 hypothetical protein RSJ17_02180 [Clostridium argentinense]KIE45769.1 putative membrane protein [Clostridium argentinense CDC 2741]NFF39124.1 hypothetical protein [Clostridium argentinense]NFP49536.1 hypothetical protein [Clostridium argentinense]NFP72239.1 hypothetical protein [Clostridium argentinense]
MDNEKALKCIKSAWRSAIALSLIKLISVIVLTKISNFGSSELILYALILIILDLGLAFGVYKKSRVCAVILFVCFTLSQLYMLSNGMSSIVGFIISVAFATCFFQGIRGTIHYHKNKKVEINEDSHKF